ncbi:MAG TPA: hypothetical protein VGV69_07220 [Solirubrobacterales bacterium]|nr:hypothetical protein [Solirubrobacterales bacterium]
MRHAPACLALILCALVFGASSAAAAPADLDRSFGGGDGIAEVAGSGGSLPGEAGGRMAIGPNDEIFVLYSNYAPCDPPFGCAVGLTVARYTADGLPDPAFAPGPQLAVTQSPLEDEFDLAVGPDGKPVIAAYGGEEGLAVARLGLDGRLDPSFGGDGVVSASTKLIGSVRGVPKVAVQPDGKVLVAVEGGFEGENRSILVARFTADGQLDPGFGDGGEARPLLSTQTKPAGVFVGAGGTITIPAPRCCLGGTPLYGAGFSVARLGPGGQPDPTWAGDGSLFFPTPGAEGAVEAATPTPDGGLLLSYEASTPTVSVPGTVIKLTPSGALDTSFGNAGALRLFNRVGAISSSDLALDARGRLVGVGWNSRIAVFRLRADGSKDRTFNGGERIVVPYGGGGTTEYMVGIQSSGRIVALGDSGLGAVKRFGLIALRGGTDRSRCFGKKATIVGTRGRDRLAGTPRRDVIAALAGADEVRGLSGPDLICGGKGRDRLFGGAGRDKVRR